MVPTSVSWISPGVRIPGMLHRAIKKKMIDDRINLTALLITFMHAYVSGQILVEPQGVKFNQPSNFSRTGDITAYHIYLKTPDKKIINPILISEEYFQE